MCSQPTKAEISELPLRYRVAYAVRAAQRVLPLFAIDDDRHAAAVQCAVDVAADFCRGADELAQLYANENSVADGSANDAAMLADATSEARAVALREAEDAAAVTIQHRESSVSYAVANATSAVSSAAHSAAMAIHCGERSFSTCTTDFANYAAGQAQVAAIDAATDFESYDEQVVLEATLRMDAACRSDFERLRVLATQRQEEPGDVGGIVDVRDSGELGPLWSEDSPPWVVNP